MKSKEIGNKNKERGTCGRLLLRGVFGSFYVLILLLFILTVLVMTVFRITTFEKKTGDISRTYSVLTFRNAGYGVGDIITIAVGDEVTAVQVEGLPGDRILLGYGTEHSFNRIDYQGKSSFDYDDLAECIGSDLVPEGYVLVDPDITASGNQVVGLLIRQDSIIGKAGVVLYPFSLFGQPGDHLKQSIGG